jgi:DNA-binding response OmpR family regulator
MGEPKLIWIVEDDPGAQFIYQEILELRYQVKLFSDLGSFKTAMSEPNTPPPDLVIADLHLPDASFLTMFQYSQDEAPKIPAPIIVVSSLDDLDALRICYDKGGACDYISKPFAKSELVVKVERALALAEGRGQEDALTLDPITLTLRRGDLSTEELTAKEFKILAIILNEKGYRISREKIQNMVWPGAFVSPKSLDQHLLHLRRKLAAVGLEIVYHPPIYRII